MIKLTFIFDYFAFPQILEPVPISVKEVKEVRAKVQRLELESSELQLKLEQTTKEKNDLNWDGQEKEKALKVSNKRV